MSPWQVLNIGATKPQIPDNAIKTPTGYVTPVQTVDDKGRPLTIHYMDDSKRVSGAGHVYPCPPTANSGLNQEGGAWSYPVSNSQAIGFQTHWTMPTGGFGNTASNGLYYNPVNFNYTGTTSGSTPYSYFQVTWGLSGTSVGLTDGWTYLMWYKNSNGNYNSPPVQNTMPSVPITPGSTYTVQAQLEPYPMASPSQYVVQVTLGSNSYMYSAALTYDPQIGQIKNDLKSFQDEYVTAHDSNVNLSSDTVNTPVIVVDQNNVIGFDSMAVTGVSSTNTVASYGGSTYPILTPSTSGTQVTDSLPCNTW